MHQCPVHTIRILQYISMFYDSKRLHSYLDYMSPNDYEMQLLELKKVA